MPKPLHLLCPSAVGLYRLHTAPDLMKPDLEGRVLAEQFRQARKHDEHARAREFCVGDTVFARNFSPGDKWVPARYGDSKERVLVILSGSGQYRVDLETAPGSAASEISK